MPLLVGVVSTLLTEFSKRHPAIPLAANNATAIRSVVAILSVVGTVLTAWITGDFATLEWKDLLTTATEAAESILIATGVYKLIGLGKK